MLSFLDEPTAVQITQRPFAYKFPPAAISNSIASVNPQISKICFGPPKAAGEMEVTDPKPYLDAIDRGRLMEILGNKSKESGQGLVYVEPSGHGRETEVQVPDATVMTEDATSVEPPKGESISQNIKRGKVQVLGDFIDTDALAPAEILTTCKSNIEFGHRCLKHTRPQFRARAAEGYNIVIAGKAFGCGSSRENAVSALLGCGIQAIIAKSFAFIYGRNAPNLGLLGIVIQEESFYEAVEEGMEVEVDLGKGVARLFGNGEKGVKELEWKFEMSGMEKELLEIGGLTSAFRLFGKGLFNVLTTPKGKRGPSKIVSDEKGCGSIGDLQW